MSNITKRETETTNGEGEQTVNTSLRTIWEVIDEVMSDVPDEALSRLPTDGAERHDHYLRGTCEKTGREQ